MQLDRKIGKKIEKWVIESRKALLIKGARQVGKTHIIRTTLKKMSCKYVELNLIEQPSAIDVLRESHTINEFTMGISTLTDQPLIKGETIIFIDEVQAFKEMITKIKFLVDEGSFRYILSGSLLGVELTNLTSAPVGYLTILDMFPLTFDEFLQISAITSEVREHLKKSFMARTPVMSTVNEKLLSLFRQYLVVGGMPEAVSKFAESYNLRDVQTIHEDIMKLHKMDFTQYEAENKRLLLTQIYDLIPAELLKQNKRFIVTDLKKGLHFERVEDSFLWLGNAGVAISVFNATETRIPLKLSEKQSLFKLYMSDVGMLTTVYGMTTKSKILTKDPNLNCGGIYENVVATELTGKGYRVYYYNSKKKGELDFVIEYHGYVLPIEVKSGKDYTIHSALTTCINDPEYGIPEAFVFAECNIERRDKVTYLPVYMVGFLDDLSEEDLTIEPIRF